MDGFHPPADGTRLDREVGIEVNETGMRPPASRTSSGPKKPSTGGKFFHRWTKIFHGMEKSRKSFPWRGKPRTGQPDTPKNRPFFALPLVAVFVLRNASRFLRR